MESLHVYMNRYAAFTQVNFTVIHELVSHEN
jgi:hypothetical protein